MTSPVAASLYLARHLYSVDGRGNVIFNPENKDIQDLPVIYGFNNGGSRDCLYAVLMAEDGSVLGSHLCSHEAYMPHDLAILEGSRPDRHKTFREHYPDGYHMEFVGLSEFDGHAGLQKAIGKYKENQCLNG